jgi:AraC family transcriptional regulator of adaptative response / DNA-3-methyladenine glycosylase II
MKRTRGSTPLDFDTCDRARLARDGLYDGRFVTAVKTTRIYCRPVCPARPALSKNVTFYASGEEAVQAGFRPCKRCFRELYR